MKRMNEVFELPLPLGEMDCMLDVFIHSDVDTDESVVALHAAHAINHVDALADALDGALKMLTAIANDGSFSDAEKYGIAWMASALKAYRGEK